MPANRGSAPNTSSTRGNNVPGTRSTPSVGSSDRPQQDHCDLGLIEDDNTPDMRKAPAVAPADANAQNITHQETLMNPPSVAQTTAEGDPIVGAMPVGFGFQNQPEELRVVSSQTTAETTKYIYLDLRIGVEWKTPLEVSVDQALALAGLLTKAATE